MNETKGYKNINLSDLGTRQKITQVASKVALFVPRLLGRMASKLIVNPITKLVTGQNYEDVKKAAVDLTMGVQEVEAAKLDEKIEEGYQNLSDWREDTEYYIGNLAKYKSYQSTIEDLEKKQARLLTVPKKLLVAKHYCYAMSKFTKARKEEKRNEKLVEQIKKDYLLKQAELKEQQDEIRALVAALQAADTRYKSMKKEFEQFELDYAKILGEEVAPEPVVETPVVEEAQPTVNVEDNGIQLPKNAEPLTEEEQQNVMGGVPVSQVDPTLLAQMSNMANMPQAPASDTSTLEAYGLSEEAPQKKL